MLNGKLPLLINGNSENDNEIPILLAGIDKARYYRLVLLGDRLFFLFRLRGWRWV